MEHRRTPARKALTLPGWVIICSAVLCLGAAALYAVLLLGDDNPTPRAQPVATATTAPTTAPTTVPTTTPTTEPTAEPTQSPTTDAPTTPPVLRNIAVSVYNNTSRPGLARSVAAKVESAGWTVSGTGNWRGVIPATTVYYPPGFQSQAETLARDLDFSRVRPAIASMGTGHLTLIMSGP